MENYHILEPGEVSERIFELVLKNRRQDSDLAKALGVGTSQTSYWKTKHVDPPAKFLPAIAGFLGEPYSSSP